jgi:hypothetical protein
MQQSAVTLTGNITAGEPSTRHREQRSDAAILWFVRTVMEVASPSARNDNKRRGFSGQAERAPALYLIA